MEKIVLNATPRQVTGKKVKALRRQGLLPAVIYGKHFDPMPLFLDAHEASKVLAHLSTSSLVTLRIDGKEYPALVREKQRDFIKNRLLHVDFLAVSMTEKIRTTVAIELVGTAPAVKEYNAVLVTGLDEVEIECLPSDLPDRIVVDLSALKEIGDGIYVRDLALSDRIRVLDDPDELIVVATSFEAEEEGEAVAAEGAEPEVIERGKKEEEEEE
uniref:Large ribosomal subunit protein bL25 n=1 Tax=uncultured Chloroflexota bacterium TaxID=166587 RepID=H5SL37_9CHLR|nr:50S ribosomal protein L25 [uncultured Chloroflexota bacterium]